MDEHFWKEVERAKRMTGAERLTAGLRLFDEESQRMLDEIKSEFPGISDEEARRIRRERFDIMRKRDELPQLPE